MAKSNSSNPVKIFNTEEYENVRNKVCEILDANKSEDILIMNLKPHIEYDFYFIIATALSNTHLKKLVTDISQTLKQTGIYSGNVPNETDFSSGWVALDYGEFIVHIFTKEKREFYKLEDLWDSSEIERFPA